MEKWKFGTDNNHLIELVKYGKKVATTYLYNEKDLPKIGETSIICYDDNTEACVIKTKDFKIMKFNEMTQELCKLEGEGDLSLEYWKNIHIKFFKSIDKNFNENSKIIFQIFEVVKINKK